MNNVNNKKNIFRRGKPPPKLFVTDVWKDAIKDFYSIGTTIETYFEFFEPSVKREMLETVSSFPFIKNIGKKIYVQCTYQLFYKYAEISLNFFILCALIAKFR